MSTTQTRDVRYSHDGVRLKGYFALDPAALDRAGGRLPGVVVVPEWWGHNDYARGRAEMFAGLGYAALAIDLYGEGVMAGSVPDAQRLAGPFYAPDPHTGVRSAMRARARAGLDTLLAQPEVDAARVAAVGYCMGGTVCLELARAGADLKGVISYHGGLGTPMPKASTVRAKVLVCHGADDPMVPAKEVAAFEDEMRACGADWQVISYGGAVHAFTNPAAGTGPAAGLAGVKYDERADRRSWEATRVFLGECLG